jgi:hypothetical protein
MVIVINALQGVRIVSSVDVCVGDVDADVVVIGGVRLPIGGIAKEVNERHAVGNGESVIDDRCFLPVVAVVCVIV